MSAKPDRFDLEYANDMVERVVPEGGMVVWLRWQSGNVHGGVNNLPLDAAGDIDLKRVIDGLVQMECTLESIRRGMLRELGITDERAGDLMRKARDLLAQNYDSVFKTTDPLNRPPAEPGQ